MSEYAIPVPGTWRAGLAVVDVETEKVLTPEGYRMPNGEPLRRRWSVTMAAAALDGMLVLYDAEGDEESLLSDLGYLLAEAEVVAYGGTREFDEMVLRGRFTNARRAHLPEPTWPAMRGAESVRWMNVGGARSGAARDDDVASRDVPRVMMSGSEGWERCAVHCLRDAVDLILTAGEPDAECRAWCERFLADYAWAAEVLTSE